MVVAETSPRTGGEAASSDRTHSPLICGFAEFVRITALLPETNDRVREAADACLERLRSALDGREILVMTLDKGRVTVEATVVEVDYRPSLRWLVERLDRAGVVSLEFTPAVTSQALNAFSRQLQRNCGDLRSAVLFSDLWPDAYDGLRPIERRFDGAFPVGSGESGTKWKTASRQGQMLAEMLDSDGALVAKVAELQRIVDAATVGTAGDAPRRKIDLIGRMVNLLPAEAMTDVGRMREMVDELLTELTAAISAPSSSGSESQVDHLLHRISRKYFFRTPEASPLPKPLVFGPARQKAPASATKSETETRAEELLAELEDIPRPAHEATLLDQVTDELERLGVLLHFFVRLEDDDLVERLRGLIVPSLAQSVPGRSALLQAHISRARDRFDAALQRRELHRLFDLLCAEELSALADESRLFGVENVATVYPATFLAFLDSLDPDREEDLDALERVCDAVGPSRLVRAASDLAQVGGFARHGRLGKLLVRRRKSLLPLYHLALRVEPSCAPRVVEVLLELDLDPAESAPLRLYADADELPLDYLLRLTAERSSREDVEALRAAASGLVARFVTATDEETAGQRLGAVPLLGVLRSDEAREALELMTSTRRRLLAPYEGDDFLRAARRALSRYER